MIYPLGSERGILGVDTEFLAVRLDGADTVTEAAIVTD